MKSPDLKRKLLEALQREAALSKAGLQAEPAPSDDEPVVVELTGDVATRGPSPYGALLEPEGPEEPLSEELRRSRTRLQTELKLVQQEAPASADSQGGQKTDFDDTLSMRGVVPKAKTETTLPADIPSSSSRKKNINKLESVISGGSMADLSGYKDLSKAPLSFGDEDMPSSTLAPDTGFERTPPMGMQPHFVQETTPQEVDTEFSGNVKTLIRLVNELPEGVTKQTGAQIIRLTMEAMGISMEDVLSEAQSAQSEMLDAVRANIKKIEEYKTVIRKLETDIKYYQGKANELSEIIDLFILSNTSGQKVGMPDDTSL